MTIEDKIKDLILNKYRSLREFTQAIDMPYSTFSTIMSRGIENSSVTNVIKICKALGISADGAAEGKIVYSSTELISEEMDLDHVITDIKGKILNVENLRLRGKPVGPAGRLLIVDYLDGFIELSSRQINGERFKKYVEKLSKRP